MVLRRKFFEEKYDEMEFEWRGEVVAG